MDMCMSGEEALRMLEVQHVKQEPYNQVLPDWNMPGKYGIETAREIRLHYASETTVVILTACQALGELIYEAEEQAN